MKNREKHIINFVLLIFCFVTPLKGQSLTESTFSSFSIDTEQLTATGGEAAVYPVSTSYILNAGLMEILQTSELGLSVDNDKVPVTQAKIYIRNSYLIIETAEHYHLYVVNVSGSVMVNKEIRNNYEQAFPAGMYIILLFNDKERDVYKVMIR